MLKPLFLHSSLRGVKIPLWQREESLKTKKSVCEDLRKYFSEALVVPTFTYSYCRGEDYKPLVSPSQDCGVFSEYVRRTQGTVRTMDPIFSVVSTVPLPAHLTTIGDVNCFGSTSIWAWLEEQDATIGFLNCSFNFCTFIHYVEQRLRVPYRSMKVFYGHTNGTATTAKYFVKPQDGSVVTDLSRLFSRLDVYEERVGEWGTLRRVSCRELMRAACDGVRLDPTFLLDETAYGNLPAGSSHSIVV